MWEAAVPHKAPDNLVSSKYTTAKVFVPSYEKEPPCIERLLANDYQRIWLQEKKTWDKILATRIATKKILPRMLVKKKIPSCVTVKYLSKAEREAEEKKKKLIKPYIKEKVEIEEPAKDCEMKLEKYKAKLETCEKAKSEISKEICKETFKKYDEVRPDKPETYEKEKVAKMYDETKSENTGETQEDEELTLYAETRLKDNKIVEVDKHEETELKERDKIEIGEHKEMELEEYGKMQQKKDEESESMYVETISKEHKKITVDKYKETELKTRPKENKIVEIDKYEETELEEYDKMQQKENEEAA
ncbi:hypothetical protein HN011_002545 [Eciton burchellii]|nr:hypothetical protein HN011_002545 [Eciton burchellii]